MPKLTLYRQARADGGLRTGIDIDGVRALEHFIEGPPELADDSWGSALRWYIDLIAEGASLPDTPDACRHWFLSHESDWAEGLRRVAEKLQAGFDEVGIPLQWKDFGERPEGVAMTLLISAMRRVDAREVSGALEDFVDNWSESLSGLEPFTLAR